MNIEKLIKLKDMKDNTIELIFMINQGDEADRIIEAKSKPDAYIYEMETECENWILARRGLAKKINELDSDNKMTVYDFTDGHYPVKEACDTTGHKYIRITK